MKNRLIIFTRYPEPGITKTRLIPALGEAGAADLHRQMAKHTFETARNFALKSDVELEIRYAGGSAALMKKWTHALHSCTPQGRGDLGERMGRAIESALSAGAEKAVIIGTDCPGISASILEKAFVLLGDNDLVLGPACDGGYYLIGMTRKVPAIFSEIEWGTAGVLKETVAAADGAGLRAAFLPILADVDRPGDIDVWRVVQDSRLRRRNETLISVIMPTLNEADNIAASLESVKQGTNVEMIVADCGSADNTTAIARSLGATIVESAMGRAVQMNTGARRAHGEILLFLHADTRLPAGYDIAVRKAFDIPGSVGGGFQLKYGPSRMELGRLERRINVRTRALKIPYGDQGIFVRSDVFKMIGGYLPIMLMEDISLVRRLKRFGRLIILDERVTASPRKWEKEGVFFGTVRNQICLYAFYGGISPALIHKLYYR